jgi:hypothetical protein
MTDADDGFDDDDDDEDLTDLVDEDLDLTTLDRTRADYTGVDLEDEFQPVDEIELSEEGMEFDDPERLGTLPGGFDDPDGVDAPPRKSLDPDDVGWDTDDEG